jgi:3'-phosphoadenosine 5'-phosphosulfate sulfotransferase (PAPS reductase)/FAD synthetase
MPLLNVDTGHHFPELNEFRDRAPGARRESSSSAPSRTPSPSGIAVPAPGEISRNRLQIPTLLAAIEEFRFDCCIGGARRDEEKARAKERFFSFRDSFGQWDPKNQRPEIWNLYNARLNPGENMRVFPLSNWTEMDVWEYIRRERLEVPGIYFSHRRQVRAPPRPVAAGQPPRAAQARRGGPRPGRPRAHHRRHHQHRLRRVARRHRRRHHRRDRRRPRDRARLPRRRQASEAAMEDRKKRGLFLISRTADPAPDPPYFNFNFQLQPPFPPRLPLPLLATSACPF